MSKTQFLIDQFTIAMSGGDYNARQTAAIAVARQAQKPKVTDWSRNLLTAALAEHGLTVDAVMTLGKVSPAVSPAPAAPAPAKKAERTEIQKLHTQLRQDAWNYRKAQFKAGNKVTVAAAYAKFGTAPAAVTNAPGFEG